MITSSAYRFVRVVVSVGLDFCDREVVGGCRLGQG